MFSTNKYRLFFLITLLIVISTTLLGCSSSNVLNNNTQTSEIYTDLNLNGIEYEYPVYDASITIDGVSKKTNSSGQAIFILDHKEYLTEIDTYYNNSNSKISIDDTSVINLFLNLPDIIEPDHFKNILFWKGQYNYRWKIGTYYVSIDFSKASSSVTNEAKNIIENQAMSEVKQWEMIPGMSYIKTDNTDQTDIFIKIMSDTNYYNEFPQDEGSYVVGRGGFSWSSQNDYFNYKGNIWIREDYANQQGIYTHEMGHVMGLAHPDAIYSSDSVMSYQQDIQIAGPTEVDNILLKMKMNLNPREPYTSTTSNLDGASGSQSMP